MSSYSNITIEQGTSFETTVDVVDGVGGAYDLTDLSAKCSMKKSYYTSASHTINAEVFGDPLNGQVRIYLSPAESNAIKSGRYVYDIIVYNDTQTIAERVIEGIVNLTPGSTQLPVI